MNVSRNNRVSAPLMARGFSSYEREKNDFYATDPKVVGMLLQEENFCQQILEPACGQGHISKVLTSHGYSVSSSDLIDRGYGNVGDFFDIQKWDGDIVTNPPYKYALEFATHALDIVKEGAKVAMFMRLLFLEGKKRKSFFLENPPKTVYVFSGRVRCALNGEFDVYTSSAAAFAWFVWVKGNKDKPVIEWIN